MSKQKDVTINNLIKIIEIKENTIKGYVDLNEWNKIIINSYKNTVDELNEIIKRKDELIDSFLVNSDVQYDVANHLIQIVENLKKEIGNIKKINLN